MLSDLFGGNALVKVLDYALDLPTREFSKADISRECNMSWITASEVLKKLEDLDMIQKTRNISRAQLYVVNTASPLLKALHKFDLLISTKLIEDEMKNKQVAEPVAAIA